MPKKDKKIISEKYAFPEVHENYIQKMRMFFINGIKSITREKGLVNRGFKKICDFSKKFFWIQCFYWENVILLVIY